MIEASAPHADALAARLSVKARRLAEAHAETRLRKARRDPHRWRMAQLLWPLITKD